MNTIKMPTVATQKSYQDQGRLLISPEDRKLFPEVFQFSNNERGRDVLKLMREKYGDNHLLRVTVPSEEGAPIQGSNIYIKSAVIPIVRELTNENIRHLTPALSEKALRYGILPDATSTYEDLGAVVHSLKDPNSQLAKHLVAQAREAGVNIEFPMVFPYLVAVPDNKFPGGLRLDLDTKAMIDDLGIAYHEPSLRKGGQFKPDDPRLVVTGFPSEVGEGNRTLYTAQDGLRWVYRSRDLYLNAYDVNLPYSNEAGRVSFVKGAAPQNLEARLTEIRAERDRQSADVDARFDEAMRMMRKQ